MSNVTVLLDVLAPVLAQVAKVDVSDAAATQGLNALYPLEGPVLTSVRSLLRQGVTQGWLCDRTAGAVRYSRVAKTTEAGFSLDAVHMAGPAVGHLHPRGEVNLCFAVDGLARFDGYPQGWVVYPPNTWHVPTVTGGSMDILYFLPSGSIVFGPAPEGATLLPPQLA